MCANCDKEVTEASEFDKVFKEAMAKDAAKVFTGFLGDTEVTASANLQRNNVDLVLLLTEGPGKAYEVLVYLGEIEPKNLLWTSIGQGFDTRRAASDYFDSRLEHYKNGGFKFVRYED